VSFFVVEVDDGGSAIGNVVDGDAGRVVLVVAGAVVVVAVGCVVELDTADGSITLTAPVIS
jgi:hypothetical protein